MNSVKYSLECNLPLYGNEILDETGISICQLILPKNTKNMECYICGARTGDDYFCEKHKTELKQMLYLEENVAANPNFRHHCAICGEYKDRIIIEYPGVGYFCNREIDESYKL